MAALELIVRTDPTPAEIAWLEDRLYDFNAATTGIVDAEGLAIFGRDDQGQVVAGLSGYTWGGCCEIRHVWVHEDHRGQGIGRSLLELAEGEALRRGCFQVVLVTHSFQAPAFYHKLGFEVVGSLADYPRGHQHLTMRKVLRDGQEAG